MIQNPPVISTKDVKQMATAEVVREYREVTTILNRPRTDTFFGWAGSFEGRIQDRIRQLEKRLAAEFVKKQETEDQTGDQANE